MTKPDSAESAGIDKNHFEDPKSLPHVESGVERSKNESGLFSTESVLNILKLIFAGSPLPEVLTIIARLVESQGDGLFCTIWLLDEDGKYLHCAAAPSLPGFVAQIGRAEVCAKGASCGTAVYRREPVYVTDILTDPIWENYRERVLPYGIRSAWSLPLFTREGRPLGAFSIHSREPRNPSAADLQLIENASDITGIAIERHLKEEQLRRTEAYLSEAERLSHSGSFVWDVHRPGPSYWSAEMYRIHRRDPSQGPPLFEEDRSLQSTEDWAGLMAAAEKSTREKTNIEYESRLLFPDGSKKNIRIVAHPAVNSEGDVVQFVGTTIDVTDQHRAKAALESALTEITNSEIRLRTIIDTIPVMAWCALPDGFAEFHNQRWLDYTGLSDEEARGWGWRTAIHPDDAQDAVDDWRDIIASKKPREGERLIRRFDGEYRRHMYRAEPLMDDQGNVVRWYGTLTDIEDRKRAEDRLRTSEQNFRQIVNSIPGLVSTLTMSGEIEFVNNQTLEYLGKPLDELKNWAVSDAVYTDDLPNVIATLRTSIETGQPTDVELRLRRADGVYRWFLLRRLPQRDADGRIMRWYTLMTDVEDRKQAEDNIRRSEADLRQILDFAPQYVAVLAPDRDRTRLYANQIALDYLGFTLEEWRNTDRREYVHPDDWERVTRETQDKLLRGLPHEFEVRLRGKDGKYRWFLRRRNPVRDEQGRLTRWYSAATDIDDRKRAEQRLRDENIALREEVDQASMFEEIVGSSSALRRVLSQVAKVAPTDSTVLILGETGTGKELIARAIHNRSNRSTRAFVRVNCAAIPQSLIASELFGHEKGAFTGATQRRLGRFELAHEGTIFLDEVGELPAETQITLLRVLQEREFERVGGTRPISVDVRVLAATNRDLDAAVGSGSFRQDLFYRLNVFPIEIPPLRERIDDIPVLVEYLVERYAKKVGRRIRNIKKKTLEQFQAYAWPGNIRELQNVVERAVVLSDGDTFCVDQRWLEPKHPFESPSSDTTEKALRRVDPDREREIIEAALAETGGRIAGLSGAAARLGIPRQTLDSRIDLLGINKSRFKSK
ncbi:sigma 54-interacting transcriptional regulator [Acidicapsa acidisoli]|uniref:sigma 54-interacting transcriptional regulator n=1 Tax=Acidicapsa acidisoli TaxID=1615681 RepID=UPI0021E025ED|nr:sigma 54-interacting transcriptional regulator [Acidicapsa acidisoli]